MLAFSVLLIICLVLLKSQTSPEWPLTVVIVSVVLSKMVEFATCQQQHKRRIFQEQADEEKDNDTDHAKYPLKYNFYNICVILEDNQYFNKI